MTRLSLRTLALRVIACLAPLGLVPSASAQTNFWVDPVNGSDAASGTNPSAPLKTIHRALSFSSPGETVNLLPGVYSAASGESFPVIVRRGRTCRSVGGSDVTILDAGPNSSLSVALLQSSTLSGVTILGAGGLVDSSDFLSMTNFRPTLRDCQLLGGLTAFYGIGLVVDRCAIRGQSLSAVNAGQAYAVYDLFDCEISDAQIGVTVFRSLNGSGTMRVALHRCRIFSNQQAGIVMNTVNLNGSSSFVVQDCLVVNNGASGLEVDSSSSLGDIRISGCTFAGNGGFGANLSTGIAPVEANSNILANNAMGDYTGSMSITHSLARDGSLPVGSGNLDGDPRFVDAVGGDWSLRFDSPCLDTGSPTGSAFDIVGHPRAVDSDLDLLPVPDMGAFEHLPLIGPTHFVAGQPAILGVTGPSGGFSTIAVSPAGFAAFGASTPFGRFFLAPQGVFRTVPVSTTGGGPTWVDISALVDPAWIGTTVGFQALPRSTAAPAGGAFSNPLLITVE